MSKIVFIDDEQDLCALYQDFFEDGHEVNTFTDAKEGLDYCLNSDLDVIFIDFRMPKLNGVEVCEKLQDHKAKKVLITGELEIEGIELFDWVASKPIQLSKIEEYLENNSSAG